MREQLREEESRYLMGTFRRLPVAFTHGRGARLFDDEGREYIDMVGGIAVNALGHGHPAVTEAVATQAARMIHVSNLYFSEPQVALARRIVELSFPGRVFFCNSGAEAVEGAIKLARKWGRVRGGGRFEVICAERAFHGRTLAAVTAGGQPKYSEPFGPLPAGFPHVKFGDIDAVRAATGPDTVAVMVEPVIGEGGVLVPYDGYLRDLRAWCDEKDLLLILDEVQTGIGRTGRWFAHQHEGITPDVMTLAKGLGGGVPIGALVAAPRADVFEPGDHGSTFGGNPLACAAGLATLGAIEAEDLVQHAAELGELLQEALRKLPVQSVRGRGLLLAVELGSADAKSVQERCLAEGLVVNAIDDSTLRLAPPLVLTAADAEEAVARLARALAAGPAQAG